MTETPAADIIYALIAQKRAIRKPDQPTPGLDTTGKSTLAGWVKDEEGFLKRWPDNRRPDTGTKRGRNYKAMADEAVFLNNSQLQSGFLDWLYVVDVDFPVHQHTSACGAA